MQLEERAIELVLPYEKNARKIPRSSIDKVAKSLEADGRTFKKVESARKKEK